VGKILLNLIVDGVVLNFNRIIELEE